MEEKSELAKQFEKSFTDEYRKKELKKEFLTAYIRQNIKEIRLMNADEFQRLKKKLKKDMKKLNLQ